MPSKMSSPRPVDHHVGARIRQRRTILGMSQEKLAAAIGLTFQQVQKYERGATRVTASKLHALAQVFGVPISFFFESLDGLPADATARAAAAEANGEGPVMHRRETWDLVQAWYRIDLTTRKKLLELIKAMAPQE
jgi:transcriptional regulator with XRE-family HTH domain